MPAVQAGFRPRPLTAGFTTARRGPARESLMDASLCSLRTSPRLRRFFPARVGEPQTLLSAGLPDPSSSQGGIRVRPVCRPGTPPRAAS